MKITNARLIVCSPDRNFVTLKIETDEGVYGLGDATLNGRELAVASYLSEHVIPCLIGRDPSQIEDIWQYLYRGAYWRRGPVTMTAIAAVDVETIDRINIRNASLLAMRTAVQQLGIEPDYLLIDGCDTIDWPCPQESVIHGDGTSYSIAAASILAKVYRDRMLVELDAVYPGYGLAKHKGYCSREHRAALDRLGPTPLHRRNWSPVMQTMLEFSETMEIALD